METNNNELAVLATQAAALDGEANDASPEGVQAQQEAQQLTVLVDRNTQEVAMLLSLMAPAVGVFGFPAVAKVFDDQAIDALSTAWGPVLTKYGIDLSNLSTRYKEEIGAAFVTVPIAKAVYAALKEDAAKGKKPEEAGGGESLPDHSALNGKIISVDRPVRGADPFKTPVYGTPAAPIAARQVS